MCGIIAYLGSRDAFSYIIAGLLLLQNRGYDSAGICTLDAAKLNVHKYASKPTASGLDLLAIMAEKHAGQTIGIGHTRWATHGAKTDTNAHPHLDSKREFAVVHNGIIENYLEIRARLEAAGVTFESQTDTEVVPKLLEYNLAAAASGNIEHVIEQTIHELQGTWALCILYTKTPDTLYLCKNGSPLVLSYNEEFMLVASEQLPLSTYFNNYITLHDGDIVTVHKGGDGRILFHTKTEYREHEIENKVVETTCAPYAHWTLKEIYEQPASILRTLNMGGRLLGDCEVKLGGLDSNRAQLLAIDHMILLGCGTSGHAGHIGVRMLQALHCMTTVTCIDASEFTEDAIPGSGKTGFVLLSQSGETKDVHRCIALIRKADCPILSIVNVVGSLIARESDCGIYLNAGREVGVASTKSFTSQVVALALLATWYSQHRGNYHSQRLQIVKHLRSLSSDVETVLASTYEQIKRIASRLVTTEHMFLLGRGPLQYIADEAALKIKEIAYIHAEGYAGGALKHGPFALIDPATVVIVIAPRDDNFAKMINAAAEIHSRHARILLITNPGIADYNPALFEEVITVPANPNFQTVLSMIPLQLLAYEIAICKGYNPDFPRNLAKVVTVDG